MSFNRMVESTASELQSIGVNRNKINVNSVKSANGSLFNNGGQTSNSNTTTTKPSSKQLSNKPPVKYEPVARHHRIRTHVFSAAGAPNAREKNSNENIVDVSSHKDHQTTWHGGVLDRKTQQLLMRNRRKSFSEK